MRPATGRSRFPPPRRAGLRLLLAAAAIAVAAAPARADTLADAIGHAFATNPDLLAQRAQLRAINERYVQARASLGFTLNASETLQIQHARVNTTPTTVAAFNAENSTETVSLVQPLYTGGRAKAAIDGALATVFVAYQNVRLQENRILNQVVTSYINVLRDQEIVEVNEENVALLDGQVKEVGAKLAVHEGTYTDRDQAAARIAAARAQLALARAELEASRSRYLAVVGRPPGVLAPAPPLPDLARSEAEAQRLAQQTSPELLSAEYQEKTSRAGIAQARAQGRPSVSLRGDIYRGPLVGYESDLRNNSRSLRMVVDVPLFASGAIRSRVREAEARNEGDADLVDSASRQVTLAVSQAWLQIAANEAAATLYAQQVSAQSGVYRGTRLQEKFALRTTLDILNAAQELNVARLNLAAAVHDSYAGKAALLAAAGRLDPAAFGVAVAEDLAPDIKALNRRDSVPWLPLIKALDAIGQGSVFTPR